jgi:hypothetical protein
MRGAAGGPLGHVSLTGYDWRSRCVCPGNFRVRSPLDSVAGMSGAPKPSGGLGPVGRSLHRRVLADVPPGWELDAKDHHNLDAACRAVDRVHDLEQAIARDGLLSDGKLHPAVVESRLQVQLAVQLLGKVETAPPAAKTGHLNGRQRAELRRLGNGAVG